MLRVDHEHPAKTLGPQAARLVVELHERRRLVFGLHDVQQITGLGADSARSFLARLAARGIVTRLKPGLFVLVPFDLGHAREYLGNPYVVARELVDARDYYLSHASAMEIHQMTTQPQLVVYTTTLRARRPRTILGTEFRFVRARPAAFFGAAAHWVDKTEKVMVSDPERTVLDGLAQPEYCGGITEVAKGVGMRRPNLDPRRLVDYALRLDVGAVLRRLGFLMELYEIEAPDEVARLRSALSATYHLLDPGLPAEGRFLARWRLRLNVDPEELRAVGGT
ncbi:MAG: transcriptional regulator [Deltaproteobacteria bacterium]|nr:transcriptional regulator [Deltaproteobacteria bacterium]